MSSKPISDLSSQYANFNGIFEDLMNTPISTLEPHIRRLWRGFIKQAKAVKQADFTPLSNKITSQKELILDIDNKTAKVYAKLSAKSRKMDLVEPWSHGHLFLSDCVGYPNPSNNCWATTLLQMCQQIPHLSHALQRVGTFCKNAGNIDLHYMERVLNEFQNGTPLDLNTALSAYRKINHLIYKLNIVCHLKNKQVAANILSQFPFPINAYRERIREKMQLMLASSGKGTVKDSVHWARTAIEQIAKDDLELAVETRKKDGSNLLNALEIYLVACMTKTAVPSSVSQDVREAFHRLFTNYTPTGDVRSAISFSASRNEDVHEAIENLMGIGERFSEFQNQFDLPEGYFSVHTTRIFIPLSTPPIIGTGIPSTLPPGNFLTEKVFDHEIRLNLPNYEVSLEDLLNRNARIEETFEAPYFNQQQVPQQYRCKETRTCIQGTPEQLTFQLVRFTGLEKNRTPVLCQRYMILPADITTASTPVVYQLESFVVHIGSSKATGHYIAYRYRKKDNAWIECNDGLLYYKSDDELDAILQQRTNSSATPYILYYSRVPDNEQNAMYKVAAALAQKSTGRARVDHIAFRDQETLVAHLHTFAEALKGQNKERIRELYKEILKESPECAQHMHRLLQLSLNRPLEEEDPTLLKTLIRGVAIPEYVHKYETLKLKRIDAELSLQAYKYFCLRLFSQDKGVENIFADLPQPLREQIQELVAPNEQEAFEMAPKYNGLRVFILERLDSTKDLSTIERNLEQQIYKFDRQQQIEHLEDYMVLLRTSKADKELLYRLLESFHLPETTFDRLLHGINIRRWGTPMNTRQDRNLNILSLQSNPQLLLQPNCIKGAEKLNTPSIIESAILAL